MTQFAPPVPPTRPRRDYRASQAAEKDGCLATLIGFVLVVLVVGLLVMFAWNVGVVPIVAAAGGHVAKIGYLTAIAGFVALSLLGGVIRGRGK